MKMPMRSRTFLAVLSSVLASPLAAQTVRELKLGHGEVHAELGTEASIPLLLTSTDDAVQGFVAVFEWDVEGPTGRDLIPGAALAGADTVAIRVEPSYMVIGVVMDSDPLDDGGVAEIIPAGEDIELAAAMLACRPASEERTWPLRFVDGEHSASDASPALDNIIVIEGLSVAEVDGLVLTDGALRCAAASDALMVEDTEVEGSAAGVRVLMDAVSGEVEGFQVAACYDAAAVAFRAPGDLDSLLGSDAAAADFVAVETAPGGVAVGVVIDLVDPMQFPPNIQPGKGLHVLTLPFECIGAGCPGSASDPCLTTAIALCDSAFGDPPKENIVVVGGLSILAPDLSLTSGELTFCPTSCTEERETSCDDGIDNDCDGLIDADDPDCRDDFDFEVGILSSDRREVIPVCLEAAVGEVASGMLWLNSPDVIPPAGPDAVQGFSLALAYPCEKVAAVEELDIAGTTLEAIDAEFIGVQAGPGVTDTGEPVCSMVIGVLIDSLAPFDGQVIPGLPLPQAMGRLSFTVLEGVECGEEVLVVARDGVRGRGNTPIFNQVSVENYAYPAFVRPIEICGTREARFFRGDCNFSMRTRRVDPVEIADAAASVSFLFGTSAFYFDPPCLDACDANDDGRINLGDTIAILYFLFIPGTQLLPPPGPGFDPAAWPAISRVGPGVDPTEDPLDCVAGTDCSIR